MIRGSNSPRESLAERLGLLLCIAPAAAYLVVWSFQRGCGPPGHSTAGRLLTAAPFAFPGLAVVILLIVGAKLRWRPRTVLATVVTVVGAAAVLEILVFLLEFGTHHCGA